jgi:hypothetical protein
VLRSQIGLQLWKIWTQGWKLKSAWETIRGNIKISAKESVCCFGLSISHGSMKDAQNY